MPARGCWRIGCDEVYVGVCDGWCWMLTFDDASAASPLQCGLFPTNPAEKLEIGYHQARCCERRN